MNKTQLILEIGKAIQMLLGNFDVETDTAKILEVPSLFPRWKVGKLYKAKEVVAYGVNSVGDAQLYQVLQEHTSSAEWTPDIAPSLYKKIGVNEEGIPEWVQPLGSSDAYMKGDIVMYKGVKYISNCNNNVWSPDNYGWEVCS